MIKNRWAAALALLKFSIYLGYIIASIDISQKSITFNKNPVLNNFLF